MVARRSGARGEVFSRHAKGVHRPAPVHRNRERGRGDAVNAVTGVLPLNRLGFREGAVALAAAILISAFAASARAEAPVQPYGTNDAGGFRNVLPAGENGLDNAAQLAEFEASREKGEAPKYPPHFADQLPLYADLLYASPTLTHEQIPSYYKDATFGVKEGEV